MPGPERGDLIAQMCWFALQSREMLQAASDCSMCAGSSDRETESKIGS